MRRYRAPCATVPYPRAPCPLPRDERLSAGRVALPPRRDGRRRRRPRRRRRRPRDPVRRRRWASAPATSPTAMDNLPGSSRPSRCRSGPGSSTRDGNPIATSTTRTGSTSRSTRSRAMMVKAIVAIEDYRFYEHGALDLKGTLRALRHQPGHRRRGPGWLVDHPADGQADAAQPGRRPKAERQAATDDTYARKLRELRYAIAFEEKYSKDWILERYLNIAYFGDGAYGIQAAARHYFGKSTPSELNLRQSAHARRPGEEPRRLRPDQLPRPRPRAAQRRARPDGAAQRHHPRAGRRRPSRRSSASHVAAGQQRLRQLPGAVLLRLRVNYLLAGPRARQAPSTSASGCSDRRPDHPDHGRPALPAGRRRRRQARTSSRPTRRSARWRWSSPAPARSRRWPSPARWAAARRSGETFLNYMVPQEYGDANGFQAGSTFKVVRAGRRDRAGHPARTRRSTRRSRIDIPSRTSGTATATYHEHRRLGPGQLHRRRHLRPLHRHPAVGEHLLRPARAAHRALRALPARQGDGHRADRPRTRERCPSFTLGVADRARWRWPRPTRRSPPAACTATPGR